MQIQYDRAIQGFHQNISHILIHLCCSESAQQRDQLRNLETKLAQQQAESTLLKSREGIVLCSIYCLFVTFSSRLLVKIVKLIKNVRYYKKN